MDGCKGSYELCEDQIETALPPYCPHGPTLLFSHRNSVGDIIDKFYACAACRSRKDCNFYQKYGNKVTQEKIEMRRRMYNELSESYGVYHHIGDIYSKKIKFCVLCGLVVNEVCAEPTHSKHHRSMSADEIRYPSLWLPPKQSNKSNAQYFFCTEVIDLVATTVTSLKVDSVLCIGTPTIYEHIKHSGRHSRVDVFLLDLDVRMRQFHSDYAHYNMFNHHFYNEEEEQQFAQFLTSCKNLLVVVDPPYGGLVQALSHSISKVESAANYKSVFKLLFFPYFMEYQVKKYMPTLAMSDYKVNYSNHKGYRGERTGNDSNTGKARGSPARIYTDLPLKRFVLPTLEGYRYCQVCEKYINKENKHCDKCGVCTTKDGPTYTHCDICTRCVKPSRVHCIKCNRCEMRDHACKTSGSTDTLSTLSLDSRYQASYTQAGVRPPKSKHEGKGQCGSHWKRKKK